LSAATICALNLKWLKVIESGRARGLVL